MLKNKQAKKLSNNEDAQNYKVKDVEIVPNRFICFIKIKIDVGANKYGRCYGSGVILGDRWVLTAAHNVKCHKILTEKLQNMNIAYEDKSYVKLAVHDGSNHGEFDILKIHISTKKMAISDYALLEIRPKPSDENFQAQNFYPVVVILSKETRSKIKQISVHGYPQQTNLNSHLNKQDQHSISNVDIYGAKGAMKSADDFKLSYQMPTEKGVSGGPIFTKIGEQHFIIGIHKGYLSYQGEKDIEKQDEGENVGVIADLMQEEVNEWGLKFISKPFIFTEKTLGLRKNEDRIPQMEIFYMADRGLNFQDILVITAYDLKNLKKLILSGNNLQQKGVECLLRKEYPNLNSLSLPQNSIESLEMLTDKHWQNIASVSLLVLSVNKISVFPKGLSVLKKLQNLWLSYNRLSEISDTLLQFCTNLTQKVNIFLYDNKIKDMLGSNKEKKQALQKSSAHIIWTRQQKAQEFP